MFTETMNKEKLSISLPVRLIEAVEKEAKIKYPQKRGGGNRSRVVEDALDEHFNPELATHQIAEPKTEYSATATSRADDFRELAQISKLRAQEASKAGDRDKADLFYENALQYMIKAMDLDKKGNKEEDSDLLPSGHVAINEFE